MAPAQEVVPCGEIAEVVGYSYETVEELLRIRRTTGKHRVPRQGRGKRGDPRWIFAGPHGNDALAELDRAKFDGDDADLCLEVHERFQRESAYSPAYRTSCDALAEHLDYTTKRVR